MKLVLVIMSSIFVYITILLFIMSLVVARLTYLALVDIKYSLLIPKSFYDNNQVEYEFFGIQQHCLSNSFKCYDIAISCNDSIESKLIKFLPKNKSYTSYVARLDKSVHSFTVIATSKSNIVYIAYYSLKI